MGYPPTPRLRSKLPLALGLAKAKLLPSDRIRNPDGKLVSHVQSHAHFRSLRLAIAVDWWIRPLPSAPREVPKSASADGDG